MKILGIDPGFGLCGFAVLKSSEISSNDLELESFGVIETKPQTDFSLRLMEIAQDFESLLKKFQPDIVSIEDLFFVQNITTGIQVAQARGVILFLAKKFGCQIIEPKPVEVKSSFTGNGKASKYEMKKMAQMIFDLEDNPEVDDAADAIAIAYFALNKVFLVSKK